MSSDKNPNAKANVTWLEAFASAAVAAAVVLVIATIAGFLLWAFLR